MSRWPEVVLGEVLRRADRFETKDDLADYVFAGTYSFARGIFRGETKTGSTFRLPAVQRVRTGDFIYCKIMAWEGAFGVAPPEVDGCVLSGAFVVYEIDETKLEPAYLDRYFKQRTVWQSIGSRSTGTNVRRRSLHPDVFEAFEMPLPPIEEQRRVVNKLDRLASATERVATLQGHAEASARALARSLAGDAFTALEREFGTRTLRELGAFVTSGPRNWSQYYSSVGDCFYRAQDIGPTGETLDQATQRLAPPDGVAGRHARVRPGDVLVVITGATVGRVALLRASHEPGFVSQHVALCRVSQDILCPDYLAAALLAPGGQEQLLGSRYGQGKPGLNLDNILDLHVPVPDLVHQRDAVDQQTRIRLRSGRLTMLRRRAEDEVYALVASILDAVVQ